jgi:hypothetical protein
MESSMPWKAVQLPNLLAAMDECQSKGVSVFRTTYGRFHEAKDRDMYYCGRGPYEARPLLAAAYANLVPHGPHIGPKAFTNNDAHDFLVQRFGFEARKK